MTNLKPCPFCGGVADSDNYYVGEKEKWYWIIFCLQCGANMNEEMSGDICLKHGIDAWNKRVPPQEG